jgi:hypothetical protein
MGVTESLLPILLVFVLPITIVVIATNHKKNMAELKLKLDDPDTKRMVKELEFVKNRLEILEAIVTDEKYQLNAEISALSTKPWSASQR